MEGFAFQPNIRELYLSYNFIENIQGLNSLLNLQTLDLSHNKISDLNEIKKLQFNKNLKNLLLEGNPIENIMYITF